ncbi:MAG: serine hydrolase [Cyclobacteriaceae bacterium]|jgi:beta-N-acetylhexosaminidase|nr:serine hydrolase [Cyclobacteriaceae bacterium]
MARMVKLRKSNGRMLKKVFFSILFILTLLTLQAQDQKKHWIDSVFQTLNTQEKIGQLFMISADAYASAESLEELSDLVRSYRPGGILITHGGPKSHANLINKLQQESFVPLLVGINAEWGLGQSLDSVMQFQKPLLMGAASADLAFETGKEIAQQMSTLGIHINFAPNADFDLPANDYPNALRYFSDQSLRASERAIFFTKGLQIGGTLTCAKHLPIVIHTQQVINKDTSQFLNLNPIDSVGLSVFQALSNAGVDGILTSHLHIKPARDGATITQLYVSDILRNNLHFKGLIFGEIPYIQKIAGDQPDGEIEKLALEMGHDMLINPDDLGDAIKKISRAVRRDDALAARLNDAVRKILEAKYKAGLLKIPTINTDNLVDRLNSPSAKLLKHQLAEGSVTLLSNSKKSIPIAILEGKKFTSISIGKEEQNEFTKYLNKYANVKHFSLRQFSDTLALKNNLADADVIIVGIFPLSSSLIQNVIPFIRKLASKKEVIICHFGNPEEIKYLKGFPTVLAGYTDEDWIPKVAAQIVFGGLPAQGTLPFTISNEFKEGQGLATIALNRFSYSLPEASGMDSKTLEQINAIAREAIDSGATPGSSILVARGGKVIYEYASGWLTYKNKIAVTEQTIYDLASVTKVSATLQTVMFMYEKGLIDINKKVSVYLPELKTSNKKDFTIKDILTHQAGLWPFLPFWAETVKNGSLLPEYYNNAATAEYPFPVADGIFASKVMKDSLWSWIIKAKIREKPPRTVYDYRYSDMGFYILQRLAEKMLNQPMQDFLDQNLYEPLGAYTLGYLPLQKFPINQIAPTEDDKLFRKELLIGYVHDQGAAMYGNIAGHAGLFSNANDLAKLGQMLLQKGSYGGQQFYKPETIELFIGKQYETSRRGLGWDKPTVSDWAGPTTLYASNQTFGHTGFTGTCIWVDPAFDLVFIFLSNRVNPDMTNNKLINANIRPRIQEVVYKAIFNYCQY